jgi:hypothetical protein
VNKTALQRDLEGQIICTCGSAGCVRATLENCPMRPACHGHTEQLALLQQYINEGKNREEILTAFVEKYGAAVLAVPSNTGINSLAWVLPYAIAGFGLLFLIITARRWSARPAAAGAGGANMTVDSALDARLDDELRDLD